MKFIITNILLMLMLLGVTASSQHLSLLRTVTGKGGGGLLTSANYSIGSTIGQSANGTGTSANYTVDGGFWSAGRTVSNYASVLYSVRSKWNIISVPLTVANYSKSVLYPTSVSNAFAYNGAYSASTTLTNGKAYWLKFAENESVPMQGYLRSSDTIPVTAGWNMIGSVSVPVPVSSITSSPAGLVTSQFYGYDIGYTASSTIEPGKGYWVKVNQAGTLTLSTVVSKISPKARIKIKNISEMPPPPPVSASSDEPMLPKEFALSQNYPNPFNPVTTIQYALPVDGYVTLKVFNMLGQEVATLVNEMQDAGYKSIEFNGSNFPSGMYFYKIQAGDFTDIKKLVMIK